MRQYILDTNAILRYLLGDVPHQAQEMKALFLQAKAGKCGVYIPLVAVVEAIFVLTKTYRIARQEASKKFSDFIATPYFSVEKSPFLQKALFLFPTKTVSFVDILLATEAKETGKTLVTFDKKLKQFASAKA